MIRVGSGPAPDTLERPDGWRERATCTGTEDDLFFPEGRQREVTAQTDTAKALCAACPVNAECLAYALDTRQEFGIWGGLDPEERRQLQPARTPKQMPAGGRPIAECGTPAAYERHRRHGEPIDQDCWNNRSRRKTATGVGA